MPSLVGSEMCIRDRHDISGSNYVRAVSFCEEGKMSESQRGECFTTAFIHLQRFRTAAQIQQVCSSEKLYSKEFCKVAEEKS